MKGQLDKRFDGLENVNVLSEEVKQNQNEKEGCISISL